MLSPVGSELFDKVVVAVAINLSKNLLVFTTREGGLY